MGCAWLVSTWGKKKVGTCFLLPQRGCKDEGGVSANLAVTQTGLQDFGQWQWAAVTEEAIPRNLLSSCGHRGCCVGHEKVGVEFKTSHSVNFLKNSRPESPHKSS